MIKRIAVAALTLFVCSCIGQARTYTGASNRAHEGIDYVLSYMEDNRELKFDLVIKSLTRKDICFAVDDWPNNLGEVSGGGQRAMLIGSGRSLPSTNANFGSCMGSRCELRLRRGEEMRGAVAYRDFGDPDEVMRLADKKLVYQIAPYFCGH